MSNETKTCNLTEGEIKLLIIWRGGSLNDENLADDIERINYLHRRLKAFQEPEVKTEAKLDDKAAAVVNGAWGAPSNG